MEPSQTSEQVEQLRRELDALRKENALLKAVIDALPLGINVTDATWNITMSNTTADRIFQDPRATASENPEEWSRQYGLFLSDGKTPLPGEEMPLVRAMKGESVDGFEMCVRRADTPEDIWLTCDARPLRDEQGKVYAGLFVFRDVSAQKTLQRDLDARTEALIASQAENEELIGRLRAAIQELSTPILEIWEEVLALPVIGVVDTKRGAEMTERLLDELSRSRARFVILDLTGVEILDTSTAAHFMKLARAVELLGATSVLTGIRPAVAQSLVHLDVAFRSLATLHNLKHGLRYCLSRLRAEKAVDKAKAASTR